MTKSLDAATWVRPGPSTEDPEEWNDYRKIDGRWVEINGDGRGGNIVVPELDVYESIREWGFEIVE